MEGISPDSNNPLRLPTTWFWQSFRPSLVFCVVVGSICPLEVVAIVFASQVNGKYASGDFQGALSSAKQAKIWGWISMGLVILGFVLCLIFVFLPHWED